MGAALHIQRVLGVKMEKRSPDEGSPVTQVRIARPTDHLTDVVRFYRDVLGLEQISSFEGHAGYDGVMLALPSRRDHLEFTHHESGSSCPTPTKNNLIVFYVEDDAAFREMAACLKRDGHEPVEPENLY
jgi:catechol 2,3-dioxygenase-like lactoylglutathione lyase family enzyme